MRVRGQMGRIALGLGAASMGSSAGCGMLLDVDRFELREPAECLPAGSAGSVGSAGGVEQTTCELSPESCDTAQNRCRAGAVEACVEGTWRVLQRCAATCEAGECVQACTEGRAQCDGRSRLLCQAGVYLESEVCAEACVAGECRACQPGEGRCGSGGPERCAIDGRWLPAGTCAGERAVCFEGSCVSCSPGSVRCNGSSVETCDASGVWAAMRECSGEAPACLEATRDCGRCSLGARQCAASAVQICSADSIWVNETVCSGELPVCDATQLACVCQEGARACSSATLERRCEAGIIVEAPCAPGSACDTDGCRPLPWIRQFGTPGDDILRAISVDSSGGIVVIGSTGVAPSGQTGRGNRDGFVRRYGAAGEVLWTEPIAYGGDVEGIGVASDPTGGVYVTGTVVGGTTVNDEDVGVEAFVSRYDSGGAESTPLAIGTRGDETSAHVALDAAGNIYVAGDTTGVFPAETGHGLSDVFVMKLAPDQTLLWTEQFGSDGADAPLEVAVDRDGNVVVVGVTDGTLPNGKGRIGLLDAFVVEIGPDGVQRWTEQFGTPGNDAALGVTCDAAGDIVVVGYAEGALADPSREQRHAGAADAYVRKYTSDRSIVWTQQFGTANPEDASVVRADAAGNIYLGGRVTEPGNARGDYDAFVKKLDPEGNEIDSRRFGSAANESVNGLALDGAGNVIVGGHTDGVFPEQADAGGDDAWLARLVGWAAPAQ